MLICSLMHMSLGGLNEVMAGFMFSPGPARIRVRYSPIFCGCDLLFHDLKVGDVAVQWLPSAPHWLFIFLCGSAINWCLVQVVTLPKTLAPAPPADPDCGSSSNEIE